MGSSPSSAVTVGRIPFLFLFQREMFRVGRPELFLPVWHFRHFHERKSGADCEERVEWQYRVTYKHVSNHPLTLFLQFRELATVANYCAGWMAKCPKSKSMGVFLPF